MTIKELSKKAKELYENQKYDEAFALLDFETDNIDLLEQKISICIVKKDYISALKFYYMIKDPQNCDEKNYRILINKIYNKCKKLSQKGNIEDAWVILNAVRDKKLRSKLKIGIKTSNKEKERGKDNIFKNSRKKTFINSRYL